MDNQLTSKAEQAKKTKQDILEKSLPLFLEKGFKAVTMNEILKATGLSKGGFYHHFQSKEALFSELVDTLLVSIIRVPYEEFNKDSLYNFYFDYIKHVSGNDLNSSFPVDNMNFTRMIYDAIKLIPDFESRLNAIRQAEESSWNEVVKQAKENGEINSKISDEMITRLFISSSKGLHYDPSFTYEDDDIKTQLIEMWDELYNSLK